jgi:hypothetical protein
MKDSPYRKQVELLLRCLPEVGKETCFALKGGTAINLFVRDFPRLSVDEERLMRAILYITILAVMSGACEPNLKTPESLDQFLPV